MAGFVKKCPCLRPQIEEDVRELDYRHCSLTDVPADVFNFERTLEDLYIDSNQIRDLPRELFYCHGIRKLSISDNEITNIPPAIASLINLEELDLSRNGIIDMPENIKCCKYLRSVDASVNPLGKLPDGFTQLLNLTQLYLNDTFLDYLPGNFGRLSKLKILEIRENHLKTLPKSFSRLVELERLDIGHNEFTELPDVIGNLTSLLELWCDHNQITTMTPTIGNLKQLMFLDATTNHLQSLPSEIEGCSSLADLHLTTNRLQSLPDSIGNLENLTTIKVENNHLTSIPSTIGGLVSLSELNLSCNELEELPASLGLLRYLRTLYVDDNYLVTIPAEIGSCNGITVLSLRSNKLEFIPDEIGRIPRLRVLNLSDNRLRYLPYTIIKLKELQALWLSENQTRPLVPLQSDHDQDNGRKILTCYLLPQESQDSGDDQMGGDTDSFHPSIWDEERSRRQQIHFEFVEDEDAEGNLRRVPTPYPKEMREKVRHAQNLAKRQMLMGDLRRSDGRENRGYEPESPEMANINLLESPHVIREAGICKPSSPSSLHESHKLLRFDKEKIAKDKVRLQQHRSSLSESENLDLLKSRERKGSFSSDKKLDSPRKVKEKRASKKGYYDEDDGGFSQTGRPTTLGSMTDIPFQVSAGVSADLSKQSPGPKRSPGFAYCSPKELVKTFSHYPSQGNQSVKDDPTPVYSQSSKHKRIRDYDSDTGYRSESDVVRFQRQQMQGREGRSLGYESDKDGFTPRKERHRGGGYSSDVEGYASRSQNAAYRALPLNQQHNTNGRACDRNSEQTVNTTPQSINNRRVTVKNDELYHQMKQTSAPSRDASNYTPPSPGMFHHSRMLDQSSPVTSKSKQRSAWGTDDSSHENASAAINRGNMSINQQHTTPREDDKYSTGRPPPYRPSPAYATSSQNQRHLPPTPNRGSPYSAYGDRRGNNSPAVFQRANDLSVHERNETDQSKARNIDTSRVPPQSPYDKKNTIDVYRRSEISRTPVSRSDMYNYDVLRTPVSTSNQSDDAHDSSQSSGFSFENNCRQYNSSALSRTPVNHITADRSRTPQSVTGCDDDRRDSPRESGYSSREHSSHRNSPCDASHPSYFHNDHSHLHNTSIRNYEDITAFDTHSDPLSQVSSSTDSGYAPHFDKVSESPVQYSGYNAAHSSSHYFPMRESPHSREATPVSDISHAKHTDKFHVSKTKGPSLGYSVAGGQSSYGNPCRPSDNGIFVSKEEGTASKVLRPGDKILEVNGQDYNHVNHSNTVSAMKNTRTVSLYIERI